MNILLEGLDKLKAQFAKVFIAQGSNPKLVRQKHIRLGILIIGVFLLVTYLVFESGTDANIQVSQKKETGIRKIDIEELAKGASNEVMWNEGTGKKVDALEQKQLLSDEEQGKLKEYIDQDKVSKEELAEVIKDFKAQVEEEYNHKLAEALNTIKANTETEVLKNPIEERSFLKKSKIKKFGEYIPGNSYAKGKLILGVDAGVGMSAEANPRRALLRITGSVVSAGTLKSDKLIGCTAQCRAVGDISSEKVYCQLVSMTCEKKAGWSIEIPVKAEVSSQAKVGIRGEVISREGDMVLKSFLSGVIGGFGSGVAQYSQPHMALSSSGLLNTEENTAKNIGMRGLGSGTAVSSDKLSDYFIKRAEQYQPVISINEGIDVEVLFQEGFSLNGDEKNEN